MFCLAATCAPTEPASVCQIIRGRTSILLDGGASDIAPVASTVIDLVLDDVQRLNQFTWITLIRSKALTHIGETVVLLNGGDSDSDSGDTTMSDFANTIVVLVAVGLAAFLLVLIGVFILCRKWHWIKYLMNTIACRSRSHGGSKFRFWHGHSSRRQSHIPHWKPLDDDSTIDDASAAARAYMMAATSLITVPTSMTIHTGTSRSPTSPRSLPALEAQIQAAAMAVSDLTSDSGSIKSSLKMDSIKEEDYAEYNENTDDQVGNDALVLAELAMVQHESTVAPASDSSPEASTHKELQLSLPYYYSSSSQSPEDDDHHNYYKYPRHHDYRINTHPDDSEEEIMEYPTFSEDGLPEAGSSSHRSVWDTADMPPSYYDNSDPEAETPVRSNVPRRINDFDALGGTGDSYLADVSYGTSDGEEEDVMVRDHHIEMEEILLPTLASIGSRRNLRRDHDEDEEESSLGDEEVNTELEFGDNDITGIPQEDDDEAETSDNLPQSVKLLENGAIQCPETGKSEDANVDEKNTSTHSHLHDQSVTMSSSDTDEFRRVLRSGSGMVQQPNSGQQKSRLQLEIVHKDRRSSTGSIHARIISPESCDDATMGSVVPKRNGAQGRPSQVDEEESSDENDFYSPDSMGGTPSCSMVDDDSQNGFVPIPKESMTQHSQLNSTPVESRNTVCVAASRQPKDQKVIPGIESGSNIEAGMLVGGKDTVSPDHENIDQHGVVNEPDSTKCEQSVETTEVNVRTPPTSNNETSRDVDDSVVAEEGENEDSFALSSSDPGDEQQYRSRKARSSSTKLLGPVAVETPDKIIVMNDSEEENKPTCENLQVGTVDTNVLGESIRLKRSRSGGPGYGGIKNYMAELPLNGKVAQESDGANDHLNKKQNAEGIENAAAVLTSPEGVQFLEDSPCTSKDSSSRSIVRHRSLQDLRLLGPVVTDTTSEEPSLLPPPGASSKGGHSTSSGSAYDDDEEEDDDSSSGAQLELPLPYMVSESGQMEHKSQLESSILSDITNASDIETNANISVDMDGTTTVSI